MEKSVKIKFHTKIQHFKMTESQIAKLIQVIAYSEKRVELARKGLAQMEGF